MLRPMLSKTPAGAGVQRRETGFRFLSLRRVRGLFLRSEANRYSSLSTETAGRRRA